MGGCAERAATEIGCEVLSESVVVDADLLALDIAMEDVSKAIGGDVRDYVVYPVDRGRDATDDALVVGDIADVLVHVDKSGARVDMDGVGWHELDPFPDLGGREVDEEEALVFFSARDEVEAALVVDAQG